MGEFGEADGEAQVGPLGGVGVDALQGDAVEADGAIAAGSAARGALADSEALQAGEGARALESEAARSAGQGWSLLAGRVPPTLSSAGVGSGRGGGAGLRVAGLALLLALGGCAAPRAISRGGSIPTASPAGAAAPALAGAAVRSGGAGLALQLSPASGPAGSTVTVSGQAPASARPTQAVTHATACWSSCVTGLSEHALRVHWSAVHPGSFSLRLRVPETPWVTPSGVRLLTPGTHRIVVQCLFPANGCALGAQGAASFRLTGPVPTACRAGRPCARLVLSPAFGPPGTTVQLSGWAPLRTVIGRPFGPYLGLSEAGKAAQGLGLGQVHQRFNGDLSGTMTLPPAAPGLGRLRPGTAELSVFDFFSSTRGNAVLAHASFRVTAAPSWASLGRLHPVLTQPAMAGTATTDPGNPDVLARCPRGGGVAISTDGGRTWRSIPTSAAAAALRGSPYTRPRARGAAPRCATAAPAPGGTVFAAFTAVRGSGPPFYRLPMETRDGGRSWQLLPAPAGYHRSAFSRFRLQGQAVQALFWRGVGRAAPAFGLEQTPDGGVHWTPGHLACPAVRPCVTWGPAPSWTWPGVCNAQAVLWSGDGGRTWALPVWPTHVCYVGTGPGGPYSLVTLRGGRVALLGGVTYPLRLSADGGHTWTAIAVPPLPGMTATAWYPAVRLVRGGALGAVWSGAWWVLPPRAAAWCRTATPGATAVHGGTALTCAG